MNRRMKAKIRAVIVTFTDGTVKHLYTRDTLTAIRKKATKPILITREILN